MQFPVDSVIVTVCFYLIFDSMTIVLAQGVYDREVVSAIAEVLNTPEFFLFL